MVSNITSGLYLRAFANPLIPRNFEQFRTIKRNGIPIWNPIYLCISPKNYYVKIVISEVYAFFVLQWLSLGCKVNTKRMSQPDMGSIFHIKKSMKYSGYRKLLCEYSKLSKLNAFILLGYYTNIDASILVYKFRPERTGSLCTQRIRNCN